MSREGESYGSLERPSVLAAADEDASGTPDDKPKGSDSAEQLLPAHSDVEEKGGASCSDEPKGNPGGDADPVEEKPAEEKKEKSPTLWQRFHTKTAALGLNWTSLPMMFKASLPPVIAISIYNAHSVSVLFPTLGFEVAIISVFGMAFLPRGKFLQLLILNVFAVCSSAALALLLLYSSVEARKHSSPPLTPEQLASLQVGGRPPYNSSQSAVCGVWLFFSIWLVNVIRAKFPPFNIPGIVASIMLNVSATVGPRLATMPLAKAYVKQMFTAMLVALAISTGVSLIVFPLSSRKVVRGQFTGLFSLMRKAVGLQKKYLLGLEAQDMFDLDLVETVIPGDAHAQQEARRRERKQRREEEGGEEGNEESGDEDETSDQELEEADPRELTEEQKTARSLKATISALRAMMGGLQGELAFAKRDVDWGHLSGKNLGELYKLLRSVFIPLNGVCAIMDIFRRTAEQRKWEITEDTPPDVLAEKEEERRLWNEVMKQLHEPFDVLSDAIDQGLEHASIQLGIVPRPKSSPPKDVKENSSDPDVEAQAQAVNPGDLGFVRVIDEKVRYFSSRQGSVLSRWAQERGLFNNSGTTGSADCAPLPDQERERGQVQLYILLYMEQLMHSTGEAVLDLIEFSDKKVKDGTMKKNHVLLPSTKQMGKWFRSIFSNNLSTEQEAPDVLQRGVRIVHSGDAYSGKKDPEHLRPTNAWERFGDGLRMVSRFFGSQESTFGLRVACATMTVGIVCFVEPTQAFFQEQRLVWAMIIVAIGMTQTSGQSIFGFICRVTGSVAAMIMSYVIWYIVDQKTPGIIVFLWLVIFCDYYFVIRYPQFGPAWMIMIVTQVLIIGYELQVRHEGIAAAERSGQAYHPTYELAPIRLATVTCGCAIAFIWTIFPSPLTDRTWLRRDISATLYLLAKYFGAINETLRATVNNTGGDIKDRSTPAYRLQKVRQDIFGKLMLLLPSLEQHAGWQRWEPNIGGKFPRRAYKDIIVRCGRILNYLTPISYTLTWGPQDVLNAADQVWMQALAEVLDRVGPSNYTILSTLTLLSTALYSGQSLPPYIPLPEPFELTHQLMHLGDSSSGTEAQRGLINVAPDLDDGISSTHCSDDGRRHSFSPAELRNVLDARNMHEPGYIEFAILQVCNTLVCNDLRGLVRSISGLVGTVDFSFRVDRTSKVARRASTATRSKGKGKVE